MSKNGEKLLLETGAWGQGLPCTEGLCYVKHEQLCMLECEIGPKCQGDFYYLPVSFMGPWLCVQQVKRPVADLKIKKKALTELRA